MNAQVEESHSRAEALFTKFQEEAGTMISSIDETITLDREALELYPPGHYMRISSLSLLGVHLYSRYEQFWAVWDLDEAIFLAREVLSLCPQGHPLRASSLSDLSVRLSARHDKLCTMQDLDEAIVLDREVLSLHPQGHPDRSTSLNDLAVDLFTRYSRLGVIQDLDEAIVSTREAFLLCTQGHPGRSASLNNLANNLSARYRKFGVMQDLDEAIALDREALSLRPQGHPDRSMSLNNLANDLSTRYNQLGAVRDLDEAIVLDREALSLCPQGDPDRSASLENLVDVLFNRYGQLGLMQDLDEAIVLAREALSLHPQGHSNRSMSLNNLANGLSSRYHQLGVIQDLEVAIVLSREALSFRPQGHPDRWMSLSNLADDLSTRYKLLEAVQDLNEAIILDQEALSLCPQGHPDRSISLNNLAHDLSARHEKLGAVQDLDEAIVLDREALLLRPLGHPDRSTSLDNLAVHLSTRYKLFWMMQDLDEAIVFAREALSFRPQGHPDRSQSLSTLAEALSTCYSQSGVKQDHNHSIHDPSNSSSDWQEPFSLYAQLADMSHAVSPHDLAASRAWIHAAEQFEHPSRLLAYETSLRLLVQHLSFLPSLPQHLDILKKRTSSLAVDAFSACLRDHSPKRAVELLEQGRGVFWNQLTRLRSPLGDIIASGLAGETLASEFSRLTSLIRKALNSPGVDQHERVCRLNLDMQRIVTAIRELPGHSRFLFPSPFSHLQRAASEGPVIIVNASQYGCDALIVSKDQDPVHIPLSITKGYVQRLSSMLRTLTARTKSISVTNALGQILRELWDDVVFPIVCSLRTTYPTLSRIWWCPTAEFSDLPLHAAGPYRKGQPNLSALYISSYTPTLSALIHARRPCLSESTSTVKRFVGFGQATAIGQSELPSVGSELMSIGRCLNHLATFTKVDGRDSCGPRVAEELRKNQWVHFACHGIANRKEPFRSAFALYDGHLTVERIIGCNSEDPEFAYLSACHTTVGDEESSDEMIHLASAMQFVGFRSVIGTMWAVDDAETNKITSVFYKHMVGESGRLDHTRAAFALHEAMRSVNVPLDQRVLYVHIGA